MIVLCSVCKSITISGNFCRACGKKLVVLYQVFIRCKTHENAVLNDGCYIPKHCYENNKINIDIVPTN